MITTSIPNTCHARKPIAPEIYAYWLGASWADPALDGADRFEDAWRILRCRYSASNLIRHEVHGDLYVRCIFAFANGWKSKLEGTVGHAR